MTISLQSVFVHNILPLQHKFWYEVDEFIGYFLTKSYFVPFAGNHVADSGSHYIWVCPNTASFKAGMSAMTDIKYKDQNTAANVVMFICNLSIFGVVWWIKIISIAQMWAWNTSRARLWLLLAMSSNINFHWSAKSNNKFKHNSICATLINWNHCVQI